MCVKGKGFNAYSVGLDESIDINDNTQLAIFSSGVNNQFEVTEELQLITMQGRTTGKMYLSNCVTQLSMLVCHGSRYEG